ncbi:fumarylacetoacetate hydrolase domain-containing 2 [Limtongia smithiae]|uniref:fumarylacetoacetate hydrolase domain-containing 2 n=1 Tax=Limtongia smithiae TaxID=1125753 RepID=UPI0034CEAE15
MNMAPLVAWKRLVRYVSSKDGKVKYGDPVIEDVTADIGHLALAGQLEVEVLDGTDPLSALPTGERDIVSVLLGPLVPEDVPVIRCIGLNYKTHILESGLKLPECPTIFTKPGPAVAEFGASIPIPKIAQSQCDYEGELTIVIGRDAKNVSSEDALDYVAGYTVGNDISARDWQMDPGKAGVVPQWTFSKSFDKYAPLGPCIVSTSILGDASKQQLSTFVNGDLRQSANTEDLCFGVRRVIEFCSRGQTLQKGSLIMTGTPGGVGLFMKPQAFLNNGDHVSVSISGIGTLTNSIEFE